MVETTQNTNEETKEARLERLLQEKKDRTKKREVAEAKFKELVERLKKLEASEADKADKKREPDDEPVVRTREDEDDENGKEKPILRQRTEEENQTLDAMEKARKLYANAYVEFLEDRRKKLSIWKLKDIKERILGAEIPNAEFPQNLTDLEKKYNEAIVAYGNAMFDAEKYNLEHRSNPLNTQQINHQLEIYKQAVIFEEIIVREQDRLNLLKAENLPPKEKGVIRKRLDQYMNLSRTQKVLVSILLSLSIVTITSVGSVIIGASTIAAATAAAGTAVVTRGARIAGSAVLIPSASKFIGAGVNLFIGNEEIKKGYQVNELSDKFKQIDLTKLYDIKKQYDEIDKQARSVKRWKVGIKAGITIGASLVVGWGIGHEVNAMLQGPTGSSIDTSSKGGSATPAPTTQPSVRPSVQPSVQPTQSPVAQPSVRPSPQPPTDQSGNRSARQTGSTSGERTTARTERSSSAPTRSEARTETDPSKTEIKTELKTATVYKGEGIEHAFIAQIENDIGLANGLGWDGKEDLHRFAGRQAHIIALKTGYVDGVGKEVRVSEGGKMAYEIKIEDGKPVVYEKTASDGAVVEKHAEGRKFEKGSVGRYEYRTDTTRPRIVIEPVQNPATQTATEARTEQATGERPNPQQVTTSTLRTEAEIKRELADKFRIIVPEESLTKPATNPINQVSQVNTPTRPAVLEQILQEIKGRDPVFAKTFSTHATGLTEEKLNQAYSVYKSNIDYLERPGDYRGEWDAVKANNSNAPATVMLEAAKNGTWTSESRVVPYLANIYRVTGLEAEIRLPTVAPETTEEYVSRALQYAATKEGMLEKLKM